MKLTKKVNKEMFAKMTRKEAAEVEREILDDAMFRDSERTGVVLFNFLNGRDLRGRLLSRYYKAQKQ